MIQSSQRAPSVRAGPLWAKTWPGMLAVSLAILAGVATFQFWRNLPPMAPAVVLFGLGLLLAWRWRPALLLSIAAAAFLWSNLQALQRLEQVLPAGRDLEVVGRIDGFPQLQQREYRFRLAPSELRVDGRLVAHPPALLELHGALPEPPVPAQAWRLRVRTESLASLRQSPYMDLARQRFWDGVQGTGKILHAELRPPSTGSPLDFLARMRQTILERSNAALSRSRAGYIQALSIGLGNQIPAEVWQWYRDTGTAHLLVISGSHVAVVTGMWVLFWRFLWRRTPWSARWPAQQVAILAGIPMAWIYAFIAGMQTPGERAAWMITVAALAALLGRRHSAWAGLAAAIAAMVLANPGNVVDLGFWLSILAVSVLLLIGFEEGNWRRQLESQWTISVALLPLIAALFGMVSLISPLANILVIPLVELLAVPLTLLGALFALFDFEWLYRLIFRLVALEMEGVSALLHALLQIPWARVSTGQGRYWAIAAATLAFATFLLPVRWPQRWIGVLGFVPLLVPSPAAEGLRLEEIPAGSGMAVFWQQGRQSGLYTANLWDKESQRTAAAGIDARLQQAGVARLSLWVRGDLSSPSKTPPAARVFLPPGTRDPATPAAAADQCRPDRAPAQLSFWQVAAVQPCILALPRPAELLILGDLDDVGTERLLHRQNLRGLRVILAPATLSAWQRQRLEGAAPRSSIHYLGEGGGKVWSYGAGRLELSGGRGRAYWQIR
ncbi:ComEC/Rec2 family competence protein [Acidithiobacillus sp.]|uniref:ComEC/Rec2 family competence protein n=1 Tax=Acidithiobacillus sp. TaxID=1872118 RepID=UPI0025BF2B82|nr:ComEC/Rec2 family competence protein [Acidithiobacillus sp.]